MAQVLRLDRLVSPGAVAGLAVLVVGLCLVSLLADGPALERALPAALGLALGCVVLRQRVHLEVTGDDAVLVHRRITTRRVRLRDASEVRVSATTARDGATVALHARTGDVRTTALLVRLGRTDVAQPADVLQALADGLARNPREAPGKVAELLRLQVEHCTSGLPLRLSPLVQILPDRAPRSSSWPA